MLCVGDIHIKPTNVHLVDTLQHQLLEIVDREPVERVVLLGDLLDTFERVHTQALNRAYQLIHAIRERCPVVVLVGNHDLINNQQFLSDQHWMNAMKAWPGVTIVDRVVSQTAGDLRVVYVPYVPVQRFAEALETVGGEWRDAHYIFAHQEFRGCKMGAIQSTHGDAWDPALPMVVSGHIHDTQRPQPNVFYIGASIQNSFGDQSDPRVLLIRGVDQAWTEIPVRLPKKKTVYVAVDELHTLDPAAWENDPAVDAVRIVVRGDYDQFKTLTKTKAFEDLAATQKCKLVHKPTTTPTAPDPVPDPAADATGSFETLLTRKVLARRDEWLYASFQAVAYGDDAIDPRDILIV